MAAKILGIEAVCIGGGSGRSLSFTDVVVRKRTHSSNNKHVSSLVLGVGEVKAAWQLDMQPGDKLEDLLRDPNRIDTCVLALQQACPSACDAMSNIGLGHLHCTYLSAHIVIETYLFSGPCKSHQPTRTGHVVRHIAAYLQDYRQLVSATAIVLVALILPAYSQVYGDAVIDEAPLLFVSNYHSTVFLKRSEHVCDKKLWASEPIWWDRQQPSARSCWLTFLRLADETEAVKARLPQTAVPRTADNYVLTQVSSKDRPLATKRSLRTRSRPANKLMASSSTKKGYGAFHDKAASGMTAGRLQQQPVDTTTCDFSDVCIPLL